MQERLGVSERGACLIAGQHRSTQRHCPPPSNNDALRARPPEFSRQRPRWGYRRAWAVLNEEGWEVNRKGSNVCGGRKASGFPNESRSDDGWGIRPVSGRRRVPQEGGLR